METSPFTGLNEIGQVAVSVEDLERAADFYRDRLGMKFLFTVPNMAFFDCGGVRLMLAVQEEGEGSESGSSILYFRVQDIQAASRTLEERGVNLIGEPHVVAEMDDHDLWMNFFEDSEGNLLALMSEVPKALN